MGTDGQNTTTYIYNKYKLLTIKKQCKKTKKKQCENTTKSNSIY